MRSCVHKIWEQTKQDVDLIFNIKGRNSDKNQSTMKSVIYAYPHIMPNHHNKYEQNPQKDK